MHLRTQVVHDDIQNIGQFLRTGECSNRHHEEEKGACHHLWPICRSVTKRVSSSKTKVPVHHVLTKLAFGSTVTVSLCKSLREEGWIIYCSTAADTRQQLKIVRDTGTRPD